ncbi:S-layer family protein (plasmid) [Kovacikia minuta CCNUW1]|uniref:S-layer family protein n=1 Tax=Kovacikia minuta TaxID=2931930 RepID=UPI001CCAB000|nr:S-layer family protein [Kovacikia minuta]UBF30428.1 S-layer family protein [Kovacikia minuta CCNUW1]
MLRHNSLISATAGTAQAGGDGGNITINAPGGFIVAVPQENSDITANAFTGRGGNVQVTAQGIFGLQFRPRLTPFSDITASSEFGFDGVVTLDIPNIDPSRGLAELPSGLVDASNLIAQQCAGRRDPSAASSFYIFGRGGIPYRPGDLPSPQFSTGDVRPVTDNGEQQSPPALSTTVEPQRSPTQIIEATDWVIDQQGMVALVAQTPTQPLPHLPECPPVPSR